MDAALGGAGGDPGAKMGQDDEVKKIQRYVSPRRAEIRKDGRIRAVK
jgi:hypothetical protein